MRQRELRSDRTARHGSLVRLLLSCAVVFVGGLLLGLGGGATAATAITVERSTPAVTSEATVAWSGTLPTGSTAQCSVDGAPAVDCTATGGFSHTATLADGAHSFAVSATVPVTTTVDGVETTTTETRTGSDAVTVDATAPTVTVTDPADGPESPTWTLAIADATTSVTASCQVTGPESVTEACSSGSWTAAVTTPGEYALTVTATDAAGNTATGTGSYTLAPPPPAAPVVTATRTTVDPPAVTWTFTVPAGATASCTGSGPGGWSAAGDCSTGSWTTTLAGGDGTYLASVVLTDASGSSDPGTASYELDTQAPAPAVLTSPEPLTNADVLTWGWDAAGNTSSCRLERSGTIVAVGGCASPYTVTDPADGDYQLFVTLVDAAGNASDESASTVTTVDRTGPAAPAITSAPASPNRGPSFTWNHEVTSTTECRVIRTDATAVLEWAACHDGTVTVDLTGEGDGAFTFEVRQRDELGNAGLPAASTVVLDTTPPSVSEVSTSPERSNTRTITVTWTGEGTASCSIVSSGGTTVRVQAGCTGAVDLTGLDDDTYTIEVRLTDTAGNTSAPGTATYTLDTEGPSTPVVTADPSPSVDRTLGFTWTGTGEASCSLLRAGVVLVDETCTGGAHAFSLEGRPDGSYTVSVVLRDDLGNPSAAGTAAYTLDTTAPAVPTFSAEPPPTGSDRLPTWGFSSDAGAELLCRLTGPDGAVLFEGICSSPHTQNLTTRADGVYTLVVRARDALGNTSDPATSTYLLDSEPPSAPTVEAGPATSSTRTPAWTLQAPTGTSLHCRLVGPGGLLVHDGSCDAAFTPTLPSTAPDGTYALEAWSVDAAGNRSLTAATSSYLLDTAAPVTPTFSIEPGTGSTRSPRWLVEAEAGATLLCTVTGPGGPVWSGTCTADQVVELGDGVDGDYVLTVQARDAAGNVSGTATSTYVLDTAAPGAPDVSGPAGPSNVRDWTVTWTGETGATGTCTLTRDGVLVETVGCTSGHTFALAGDGRYVVSVVLTDAAGNPGPAGTAAYVLDTAPPAAPLLSAPAGPSSDPSWPVTWTVEEGTVSCVLSSGGTELTRVAGCTSPHVVDLSSRPDGTYQLTVWTTDAAGNSSDPRAVSYVLDRQPPAPATWTAQPATSSDRTPQWSFDLPDGATAVCALHAPDGTLLLTGACTSPWTAPELTSGDGGYRLDVQARDAAGNLSAPITSTYLLDTAPPAVPVFTVEPPTSSDPGPVWTVRTDDGTTLHCTLRDPDGQVVSSGACGTTFTGDVTGGPEGLYVLEVVATDAAGNASPAGTSTFRYDVTPPSDPVFDAEPATSSSRTPTWEIRTDADTVLHCTLTGPDGVVHDGPCETVFTGTLTDMPDGDYVLEVVAVDEAGNASGVARSTYVLDTLAPTAPVFTVEPALTGNDSTPTWELTAGEGTLECRLDRPDGPGSWDACAGAFTAALAGLPDGTYTLRVITRDVAGNASAELVGSYRYDTQAPALVEVTAPASPDSTRTPTWSFTTEAGAALQCRVGDTGAWVACGPDFTLDLTGAPDGPHTIWVRAVDTAGNVGEARSSTYVLDTVAPAPATFTSSPATSSDRDPVWRFTAEAGTTARCRLVDPDGAVVHDGGCASPFTADLAGRPDGLFTLTVRVRDAAGNVSDAATSTYLLDTTPPAPPTLTAPATPGNDQTPTWGIASDGSNECRLVSGDGTVLSDWAACGSTYTAGLTGQPDGAYVVEVRTRDVAGNVSAVAGSAYVLDTAPPPAPGVTAPTSPSSGASPGFTVVLSEPGARLSCRLLHDGVVVQDWWACGAGTVGVDLSGRPDGTYRLEARLTDAATNVGPVAGADYVYDTTPPAAVVVTAPASPGSVRGPAWSFTAEPLAAVECSIGDSGAWTGCEDGIALDLSTAPAGPSAVASPIWSWTGEPGAAARCTVTSSGGTVWAGSCTSPWTVLLPADGTYTLTVVLTDAAGNASAPGTASYVLDSTPPAPPVVVGPSSPNSLLRPIVGFTSEDGARTECRILYSDGRGTPRVVADWAACTSPAAFTTDRPGRWVIEVRAVDRAGNTSAATAFEYVYDPDATTGLVDLQAPASPSTDRLPVWTFTPVPGATATCRLVGPGRDGAVLFDGPCTTSVGPSAPLAVDGEYWLSITVRDSLGNTGVNELVYELDTTGPGAPAVTPDGVESRDGVVVWDWTGDRTVASWQCRLTRDGVVVEGWTACTPGRQDLSRYGEGAYVLEVRGLDRLGNVGAADVGSYRYDLTAPAALGLSSPAGGGGTSRSVLWTFPVPGDAVSVTCGVRRGAVFVRTPTSCTGGSYVMDLSGLPEATYSLVVLFTDAAGNVREQVGTYVLSGSFVPAPGPQQPSPPQPRPTVPGPVVVEPRPRAVPAVPLDPVAVQGGGGGIVDLLGRRSADVAADVATGPGTGPLTGGPTDEASDERREPVLGLPSGPVSGARAVEALKDVAQETIRRPTLPIALLLVVGLFLLVQNRIDRRDPKLAGADVDEEPELEFAPVRTLLRPARPGGATA